MNHRLAPLRSPVALLSSIAVLCAALAGVLTFAAKAGAVVTNLGSFTLTPETGKLADPLMATSATTGTGCPDPAEGQSANSPSLWLYKPGSTTSGTNMGSATAAIPNSAAGFTVGLKSPTTPVSLETALKKYVTTESLDGTYTMALLCRSGITTAARFHAKITVVGDTWTALKQQATTLTLAASDGVSVNGDLKLTATVVPATAAGSVEFKDGDTSLGTADVTGGTAALTVKAPAIGGAHPYTAAFTPSDPDAYTGAEGKVTVGIGYLVTAKDADGNPLGDKPTLAIGESAKITIQGFTPGSTVEVSQTNATGATFQDATAGADGTVLDYAFTVPDRTISGQTTLQFREGGSLQKQALFVFDATDEEPTDDPTEPAGLEVTDEDGNALDADPNLAPGQTVKITAAGYTADATVEVTLADSEETFEDAKANAEGTVEEYEFTVPEKIEDGDHTLTLAEAGDKEDAHSVDFAFTTGAESSESPDPSGSESASGDTSGTTGGGTGGDGSGGAGGTGGDTTGTGGTMASTGAQVGAIALTALALLCAGAALVLHMRRKGLLAFGGTTPQHR
ncbi:hypothetical protein [Streptomyces sp. NPDC090994]|uniref:hypothetical protein n=1 Tax=Streptomyces sp. NPDC090994 TaxID=3365969 RepID=UPI0037F92A51